MCENVQREEFVPGAENNHFPWESSFFARGRNILEENLITGKVSINRISLITGINVYKLKKYKKRL